MLHRSTTYMMLPVVSDQVAWSVGRSVCLSVCHTRSLKTFAGSDDISETVQNTDIATVED